MKTKTKKLSRRLKRLVKTCKLPIDRFRALGNATDTEHGPYIHIDNGSDILAVGHLDYVLSHPPTFCEGKIYCGQLDDRLGVWGILDGLKKYTNVKYDILLTDSEESGQSTAQFFMPDKVYNWGFELDRAGTDCVLYDYGGGTLERLLAADDWEIGCGAFSDISYLGHLGCEFVNFGIGYHDQHTNNCHAAIADVETQLARAGKFLTKHAGQKMPYVEHDYPWPEGSREGSQFDDSCEDVCCCHEGAWECQQHYHEWTFCPYCGKYIS